MRQKEKDTMGEMIVTLRDLEYLAKSATTVKGLLRMAKKRASEQHCSRDHRHSGWTNYETWNVALWMDNEEGTQEYYADMAQQHYDMAKPGDVSGDKWSREENAAWSLSKQLKSDHEDALAEQEGGVTGTFSDLLNGALSEVNWVEIAEHLISAVDKDKVL